MVFFSIRNLDLFDEQKVARSSNRIISIRIPPRRAGSRWLAGTLRCAGREAKTLSIRKVYLLEWRGLRRFLIVGLSIRNFDFRRLNAFLLILFVALPFAACGRDHKKRERAARQENEFDCTWVTVPRRNTHLVQRTLWSRISVEGEPDRGAGHGRKNRPQFSPIVQPTC